MIHADRHRIRPRPRPPQGREARRPPESPDRGRLSPRRSASASPFAPPPEAARPALFSTRRSRVMGHAERPSRSLRHEGSGGSPRRRSHSRLRARGQPSQSARLRSDPLEQDRMAALSLRRGACAELSSTSSASTPDEPDARQKTAPVFPTDAGCLHAGLSSSIPDGDSRAAGPNIRAVLAPPDLTPARAPIGLAQRPDVSVPALSRSLSQCDEELGRNHFQS